MELLLLLAQGAAKQPQAIDESFVKWLAGFLAAGYAGYAPLVYYLKSLWVKTQDLLEKQAQDAEARLTLTEKIRKEIEEEIRIRYRDVVAAKDLEIQNAEAELKKLRAQRFQILTDQIDEHHRQSAALEKLTADFNSLATTLKPVIAENVELLSYYRGRRERGSK